jgi:histidyl-tRNA synthetase
LGPDDYEALERVRSTFIDVAKVFDFRLMEPSPIEKLHTLEAKSGPGVREEVYHFKDKGGRDVGLRFDLTIGLTRYVSSDRGLPLPVKLGAFSSMWRYDEPQYGRYRWFYQWNVEIFGAKKIDSDAEIIDFTSTLCNKLGLRELSFEIGDRTIIDEFISTNLDINRKDDVAILLRAVDKLERKTKEQILDEYSSKRLTRDALIKMMDFGSLKGEPEFVLRSLKEEGITNTNNLDYLVDALKTRGVDGVTLNMGIVRGLDYYTGIVFEVFAVARNIGALAGGGRYDVLPEIFGRKDIGATGVAGGVDRMLLALGDSKMNRIGDSKVFVGYVGEEMASVATEIASILRKNEIPTILEISGKNLRKQFEYASKIASIFVIVGPIDYKEGKVTLRDLSSGKEMKIAKKDIVERVRNI